MDSTEFQIVEDHFEIYEEIDEDKQHTWVLAIKCENKSIAETFKNQILKHSKKAMEK